MHLRDWDSVHHISRIGCDGVVNITTSNLLPEQFRPLSKISYIGWLAEAREGTLSYGLSKDRSLEWASG